MLEPCEECGATEGVRVFGTDHTPLCPQHYAEAERNVASAEEAARRGKVRAIAQHSAQAHSASLRSLT